METIFLDNASTTRPFDEVVQLMAKTTKENFHNPGALYAEGFAVKQKIEQERNALLTTIGGTGYGAVFCASATEADNLALFQIKKGVKALIGQGEHPAVYETALKMKSLGYDIEFVPISKNGKINFEKFKEMMTKDVGFVSLMHVSNETGAINNIKELCEYAKKINPKVVFHCDGVQAFMKQRVSLLNLGVDLYTISGHKINGPKGVGVLFFKDKLNLKAQITGGGQEFGLRSGTESVSLICGLVEATKIHAKTLNESFEKVKKIKMNLINALQKTSVEFKINGDIETDSPYILSVSFLKVRGEVLLHSLEKHGILVSTGSACSTKKIGNRILSAMGKTQEEIEGNIRFSFGYDTDFNVDFVANAIETEVKNLRRIK